MTAVLFAIIIVDRKVRLFLKDLDLLYVIDPEELQRLLAESMRGGVVDGRIVFVNQDDGWRPLGGKLVDRKTEIDGYKGFVFTNRYGEVMTPHNVNRAIERIYKEYNAQETALAEKENRKPVLIPHFSAHILRHTFCTRFCENETDLKLIQEIMGHADITTTMDIYNESNTARKQASFERLEGKIKIC